MSQAGSSNQRDPRVPDSTRLQGAGDERLVSIIVPCRNERGHIDAFLDSATAQQLQAGWRMEILVADGESDDGTGERIQARAAVDARLVPVANPGRIVSTGLNACLARARGAVIVRMDVHTQFAPDYVAQCITALQRTGADNVGGAWVARGEGAMGQAIAAAFQSRWVVGGALSRDGAYEGEADTVYLGCWPRQTFARVGGFDETLVRNQDDEHNLRLRLAGGCVWQSALIRSWYRPRDALGHRGCVGGDSHACVGMAVAILWPDRCLRDVLAGGIGGRSVAIASRSRGRACVMGQNPTVCFDGAACFSGGGGLPPGLRPRDVAGFVRPGPRATPLGRACKTHALMPCFPSLD